MKLIPLLENVKPKLLELQEWLLEKGWDNVELNRVSDAEYKLTLSHGPNGNFQRYFWCDVDGDRITGWYTVGFTKNRTVQRMSDREFMDAAVNELAYITIRHVLKIKFVEKPDSFEHVIAAASVPFSKLRPYIREGVLQVFSGQALYGLTGGGTAGPGRPRGPLASHQSITVPPIFVIDFEGSKHDYWLVDSTGASTYYREWARVDYEA